MKRIAEIGGPGKEERRWRGLRSEWDRVWVDVITLWGHVSPGCQGAPVWWYVGGGKTRFAAEEEEEEEEEEDRANAWARN